MYAVFQYIQFLARQLRDLNIMKHSKSNIVVSILFFMLIFGVPTLNASSSTDELCEKLHADYLKRAQRALAEDKRDDALRLLLSAVEITKKCADSPQEQPVPQRQVRESSLAFAGPLR
jgi:hypothetical protein